MEDFRKQSRHLKSSGKEVRGGLGEGDVEQVGLGSGQGGGQGVLLRPGHLCRQQDLEIPPCDFHLVRAVMRSSLATPLVRATPRRPTWTTLSDMDTGQSKETNKLLLANLGISKSSGKKVGGSLSQGGGQEVGVGGSEGGGKGVLPRLGERDPQEISAHPAGQGSAEEVGLSLGQGHLGRC